MPPFNSNSLINCSPLTATPAPSAVSSLFKEGDGDSVAVESLCETWTTATVVTALDTVVVLYLYRFETMLLPVASPLSSELAVAEGEAPFDSDDVGDAVTVTLPVAVIEIEAVGDAVTVTLPELDDEKDVIDIMPLSV